jgi:hypothetical protein
MAKTPQNHRQPWTPSQDTQFRELARGNTPTRVMGIKLRRTEDSIRAHAQNLGVSLKPTNQRPYNRRKW